MMQRDIIRNTTKRVDVKYSRLPCYHCISAFPPLQSPVQWQFQCQLHEVYSMYPK